jgi:hypothetical protein
MNEEQARGLVEDLRAAYPQQALPVESVEAYARWLVDLPEEDARRAVQELIQTSEILPTIAAIRARAAERMLQIPSADEAFNEIAQAVRLVGRYRAQPDWSTPFLREIIRAYGGWTLLCQVEMKHDEFVEIYGRVRRGALRQVAA